MMHPKVCNSSIGLALMIRTWSVFLRSQSHGRNFFDELEIGVGRFYFPTTDLNTIISQKYNIRKDGPFTFVGFW